MVSNGRAGSIPAPSTITYIKVHFKCLTKNFKIILLPLNLKTSKSVALSIIKIDQFYSIKPCTIVNGFGMDEIDSSFILTKAENENFFSPIAVFDFDIVLNYFCNKYNNYYIINNYYTYFYFINYNIM